MTNMRVLAEKIKCGLKRSRYYRSSVRPLESMYVVLGRYDDEVLVLYSDLVVRNSSFFYGDESMLSRQIPSKKVPIIDPFDKELKAECHFSFTNVVHEFGIFRVGDSIGALMGIGKGHFIMLDSLSKDSREDCRTKVFITPSMESEYKYCSRFIKATDYYEPHDIKLVPQNASNEVYDLITRWDKLNHCGKIIAIRYVMRCKIQNIDIKPRYAYHANGNIKEL